MKKSILTKYLALVLVFILLGSSLSSCSNNRENAGFTLPDRKIEDNTVYTYGDFSYCIYSDNTAVIVDYTGTDEDLNLPEKLEGNKVVAIAPAAFQGNKTLKSIVLGNDIEMIGELAFNACKNLKNVTIGKKVWSIGPDAFNATPWYESLTDDFVIVGDSLLLKYCGNDTDVVIPENVKHLGPAFNLNQNVSSVTVGDGVFTVGNGAFIFSSVINVFLGNNVLLIDTYAFQGCEKLCNVNIPDSVKQIGAYAFYGCTSLGHIKIGRGVELIDYYAFYLCSQLAYVTLPLSLKTVNDDAFKDCYKIKYVYYEGSESDFGAVDISSTNYIILDADRFYSYDYNGDNDGSKK